jgi:hypothetical protein
MRSMLLAFMVTAVGSVAPADAADSALGTFTVKGKTIRLAHVYAERGPGEDDPGTTWVSVLVSDVPIDPADRVPGRLSVLAMAGHVHALRFTWTADLSRTFVAPYHEHAPRVGVRTTGGHELDLAAYDDRSLEATLRSRMVGQDWHYNVRVKSTLVDQPAVVLEPIEAPAVDASAGAADPGPDPTAIKRALGAMGYTYEEESLFRAIADANTKAVELFLRAGMSPSVRGEAQGPALVYAASICGLGQTEARAAIVEALVAAKADVKAADSNDSTALIWAAQTCPLSTVAALIAAGADVNARARGSATPLMMAEVMQRPEVAEALKKAGARPWQEK